MTAIAAAKMTETFIAKYFCSNRRVDHECLIYFSASRFYNERRPISLQIELRTITN